jgi:hypothetical protein
MVTPSALQIVERCALRTEAVAGTRARTTLIASRVSLSLGNANSTEEETMKIEPIPLDKSKTPEQRFNELGSKIMTTPKGDIDSRNKAWRNNKAKEK